MLLIVYFDLLLPLELSLSCLVTLNGLCGEKLVVKSKFICKVSIFLN